MIIININSFVNMKIIYFKYVNCLCIILNEAKFMQTQISQSIIRKKCVFEPNFIFQQTELRNEHTSTKSRNEKSSLDSLDGQSSKIKRTLDKPTSEELSILTLWRKSSRQKRNHTQNSTLTYSRTFYLSFRWPAFCSKPRISPSVLIDFSSSEHLPLYFTTRKVHKYIRTLVQKYNYETPIDSRPIDERLDRNRF